MDRWPQTDIQTDGQVATNCYTDKQMYRSPQIVIQTNRCTGRHKLLYRQTDGPIATQKYSCNDNERAVNRNMQSAERQLLTLR